MYILHKADWAKVASNGHKTKTTETKYKGLHGDGKEIAHNSTMKGKSDINRSMSFTGGGSASTSVSAKGDSSAFYTSKSGVMRSYMKSSTGGGWYKGIGDYKTYTPLSQRVGTETFNAINNRIKAQKKK